MRKEAKDAVREGYGNEKYIYIFFMFSSYILIFTIYNIYNENYFFFYDSMFI